jgi:hypothetical protein
MFVTSGFISMTEGPSRESLIVKNFDSNKLIDQMQLFHKFIT